MFICLGCWTVMVIMSWGCLYLRCCLCGWLSLPPDVTIKSSLRLKFIVWRPLISWKKPFILSHSGKQPWQFWDLSWASKGFPWRSIPSRQGTMSTCVLPWFYPPRTVFQNEWREILAVIVDGVYVGLGLGLYYLYASANTAGWNGSQAIRSILVDGQKSCRCINQPRRRWKIVGKR